MSNVDGHAAGAAARADAAGLAGTSLRKALEINPRPTTEYGELLEEAGRLDDSFPLTALRALHYASPMSLRDEIRMAILWHEAWKERLRASVETGSIDAEVGTIGRDDLCEFGRWLYGDTIGTHSRRSPQYKMCKSLHAEFHRVAAKVATLATTGKRAEAASALEPQGEYARISAQLIACMTDWDE